jgi:CubicO group peptidase (beta-lactamase class C family)
MGQSRFAVPGGNWNPLGLVKGCALALLGLLAFLAFGFGGAGKRAAETRRANAASPPLDTAAVDKLVNDSLKAWQVPGAALAVVRDDKVIHLKGYGVRELGGAKPVTPDTVFAIASLTKAFTATSLALLVDEGKVKWDDPVRKHVPFFRLADPLADRNVTLRDLLCHRTGVAAHDRLWLRAPWSQEESIRRLAFLRPAQSFRSAYQYNNLMYMTAGFAVASAAKCSWPEFVRKRLLTPLGMKGAVFSRTEVLKTADHATPHRLDKGGKLKAVAWYPDDKQIRASGSLKAGVRDLTRWVRFQLGEGTFGGKRLLSAKNLAETHTPQMVVRLEGPSRATHPEATQLSYGLGWNIADYRGRLTWSHTGGTEGFRSHIVLVPRAKLGIIFLMNAEVGTSWASLHYAVINQLLDRLLGLPSRDWNAYYARLVKRHEDGLRALRKARRAHRHKDTLPSHPLKAYTGVYREPAYGKAEVTLEKGALVLRWSSYRCGLKQYHFDTFDVAGDRIFDDQQLVFLLGADGEVDSLKFLGVTFKRMKAKQVAKDTDE